MNKSDNCWVEEGKAVSESEWKKLVPRGTSLKSGITTVRGSNGRRYVLHTHAYGDRNIEIVLCYAGIVVASCVRPLRGKGCDEGLEAVVSRADQEVEKLGIDISL